MLYRTTITLDVLVTTIDGDIDHVDIIDQCTPIGTPISQLTICSDIPVGMLTPRQRAELVEDAQDYMGPGDDY